MANFTRFETQYIMSLAIRARMELKEMLKDQTGYVDPNIENYIETLETIAKKAKMNILEIDAQNKKEFEES